MSYLISIIIPVYNVEKYIRKALESIENQTIGLDNLEVIMVDDCSTDNSYSIMNKYSQKHNNFISIHLNEKSGAAGRPRNVGIKKATGEYIMFLDPDDYYQQDACEVLYNQAEKAQTDIAIGNYQLLFDNGNVDLPNHIKQNGIKDSNFNTIDECVKLFTYPASVWSKIFKREFIIKNGILFPEKIIAQDLVFIVHVLLLAKGISFINNIVCNYRVRDNQDKSVTYNLNLHYFTSINKAQKDVYDLLIKYDRENYYEFIYKTYLDYYITNFCDSELANDEKIKVAENMHWFFEFSNKYSNYPKDNSLRIVLNNILCKNYDMAVQIADALREIRSWNIELETAKKWLEVQLENHKNEIENQKLVIEELKNWNNQLLVGKKWLEDQIENQKNVVINKDEKIKKIENTLSEQNIKIKDLKENEIMMQKKVKQLQTFKGWIKSKISR